MIFDIWDNTASLTQCFVRLTDSTPLLSYLIADLTVNTTSWAHNTQFYKIFSRIQLFKAEVCSDINNINIRSDCHISIPPSLPPILQTLHHISLVNQQGAESWNIFVKTWHGTAQTRPVLRSSKLRLTEFYLYMPWAVSLERADSNQSEHSLGGSRPIRAKAVYISPQEQLHHGPGGQLGAALEPDGIKIFSKYF